MTSGYKHTAPPEQGSSANKRDFLCKACWVLIRVPSASQIGKRSRGEIEAQLVDCLEC
jgi:hypothetical protein